MRYLSSSEFVSAGHPDRLADTLSAIIINDIQKKDGPCSHAAIEVFLTHDSVIFGGEATTSIDINDEYLKTVVERGYSRSGYIPEMRKIWTKEEVVLPEDLTIINKICAQSSDIALGTTDLGVESGWNDQGIYFSSAENSNALRLGTPMYIAKFIGEYLHQLSSVTILNNPEERIVLGPDNKCVVTVEVAEDGFTPIEIKAITIAVSHDSKSTIEKVRLFIKGVVIDLLNKFSPIPLADDCQWVINGTGRFVIMGQVSDTSMTGRKISVNHPSAGPIWSNKMIGGGSLVKCLHASDLMLNLASRFIASVIVRAGLSSYAVVGCAGAIGQHGLQSLFIKGDSSFDNSLHKEEIIEWFKRTFKWSPIGLAEALGLLDPKFDFGLAVHYNFFGDPHSQPWEGKLVDEYAYRLKHTLSFED